MHRPIFPPVFPHRVQGDHIVNPRLLNERGKWLMGAIPQGPLPVPAAAMAARREPALCKVAVAPLQKAAGRLHLAGSNPGVTLRRQVVACRHALCIAEVRGDAAQAQGLYARALQLSQDLVTLSGDEFVQGGAPFFVIDQLEQWRDLVWYFDGAAAAVPIQLRLQVELSRCLVLAGGGAVGIPDLWLRPKVGAALEVGGDLYVCLGYPANAGGQYAQALHIALGGSWSATVELPELALPCYVELAAPERPVFGQHAGDSVSQRLFKKLALPVG